jgi:hypothetical protein
VAQFDAAQFDAAQFVVLLEDLLDSEELVQRTCLVRPAVPPHWSWQRKSKY